MFNIPASPLLKGRPEKERKHSLAIIGHMAIDTIIHPDFTIESSPGGSAAALATSAVQFGIYPSIHSQIGSDYPKEWLRVLEALGVDISAIEFLEKEESLRVEYKYSNKGEAHIQCNESVGRSYVPENLPKTDALHICPMEPRNQVELEKKYSGRDMLSISFSEFFAKDYKKMNYIDILDWEALNFVFANEKEGQAITGRDNPEEMARSFHDLGVDIAVVTLGNKGSLIFTEENIHHVNARDVEVIDSTGCGDSYIGGFLGEYLGSRDIQKAAGVGTYMASLTAQKKGSWAALLSDVGVRF
ncbi:MAG: hypothetical protein JSW28_00990 [Thermoplasmata archaeon]|nr:MAG: hypothetical protein JSW28_00990 [Thermoplasmata archaeon]